MAPPQQEQQEAEQAAASEPTWMLLDKKATASLQAAEEMMSASQKEYSTKIGSGGPKTEEEQQALAASMTMMIQALQMYKQAEGFLIDCCADTDVVLKQMSEQGQQADPSKQPKLKELFDHMVGFRNHQAEKLKGVQEQMKRMDTQLEPVLGRLGLMEGESTECPAAANVD